MGLEKKLKKLDGCKRQGESAKELSLLSGKGREMGEAQVNND